MAGYMGFGMQSWIYKRKLRKPFSKRGKVPTFSSLPLYSREFKLKPSIKRNKKLIGLLTISITLLLTTTVVIYGFKFHKYESTQSELVKEINLEKNKGAFQFLLNSGKNRFYSNNFLGAYSELVLAHKICSQDKDVINLLIETSRILCKSDLKYCEALDNYLDL